MTRLHSRLTAPRGWRTALSVLGGFYLFFALGFLHRPAVAQVNQATIQEILNGDRAFIEQQQATEGQVAQFRQTVRTEGPTRTSLAFNNGAVGRLGENATVTVGQCIEVERGQLLVSGPANGCMTDFTVAVQGTIYLLERDPDAGEGSSGTIKVLEGNVEVIPRRNNIPPTPIQVRQGQQLGLTRTGLPGTLRDLPAREYTEIVSGPLFQGYRELLPNQEKLYLTCQTLYPDSDCTPVGAPVLPTEPIPGLW